MTNGRKSSNLVKCHELISNSIRLYLYSPSTALRIGDVGQLNIPITLTMTHWLASAKSSSSWVPISCTRPVSFLGLAHKKQHSPTQITRENTERKH